MGLNTSINGIKIPTKLYNQYLKEYTEANKILKKRSKRGGEVARLRVKDLERFTNKKRLLKYIRTTHGIVTGSYFQKQTSLYRGNLIKAILKQQGYEELSELKLNAFTLEKHARDIDRHTYAVVETIATLSRSELERLENNIGYNILRYQYTEADPNERLEAIIEYLNKPYSKGGIWDTRDTFTTQIEPYIQKRVYNG